MNTSNQEVLLGQLEKGEKFRLCGDSLTVLENGGTRYVLCQRKSEVIHIDAETLVDQIITSDSIPS
jgi:hypothetical protein